MMPEDIATTVMPFLNSTGSSYNESAQCIPPIGTGSQDGFEACRQKCGLVSRSAMVNM